MQFVFMSSAIVYGESAPVGKSGAITKDASTNSKNCRGNSKVRAENGIRSLNDDSFKVVILRPSMIYSKGSKGNYPLFTNLKVLRWMLGASLKRL